MPEGIVKLACQDGFVWLTHFAKGAFIHAYKAITVFFCLVSDQTGLPISEANE